MDFVIIMSDVSGHAFVDHSVEFIALFSVGSGDAVICKNPCQRPTADFAECIPYSG